LELRAQQIPRSPLIEYLEQQRGRAITHEYRHFVPDKAVQCGEILQRFENGQSITGRYEWSGKPNELATFWVDGQGFNITAECLLRWPN